MTKRSSWTRPALKSHLKEARIQFCASFREDRGNLLINEMLNVVHVDEKWVYMTKLRRSYLVWHDEEILARHLNSKSTITKVMFLVAVARPRGEWDGKLGCWPFTEIKEAQRSSKNRPAGASIVHTVTVTRDVYRNFLLGKVFPAIKAKWIWPVGIDGGEILVQQDNARPHVVLDDPAVVAAGLSDGWTIRMMNQPPQSPDLNVLDLGFFNSIQALQQQMECRTIEDLMDAVCSTFRQLSAETLNRTFMTLQRVMGMIIEVKGDNRYKIPRSKKPEEEMLALELMNLRLEEEDRMEEICDLLGNVTM
ncbi:hypothetical protein AeMF1_021417 [Aphanomyces euteiches]|nr:hypothetical protein AeMF1_021417 [Aphanomyces euteiches]KAH9167261.1 hypothetical protein AeNC1_018184 [Aphanomyces euteiches]